VGGAGAVEVVRRRLCRRRCPKLPAIFAHAALFTSVCVCVLCAFCLCWRARGSLSHSGLPSPNSILSLAELFPIRERESAQLVLRSLISPFCRDSCGSISDVPIAPLFPLKQRSLLLSPSLLVCFLLPLRASSGAMRYLAPAPNRSGLVKGFCFFFALYLFRFLRFLCFYLSEFVCVCVRVNCCWLQSEAQ